MNISKALLPEFEYEMKNTRSVIERLPDEKLTWKPHDKSMTFGALASHLIDIPSWVAPTIREASFDVSPLDGPPVTTPEIQSREHALGMFDKSVAAATAAIASAGDETLMTNWSLLAGGNPLFTMPRISVLRSFIINHAIHHRAQLSMYLRLNDIPVPALYGPSADEGKM